MKKGLLAEDKYPNKGIEKLAKEAPEVVKRMGYEKGGLLEDDRKQFFLGGLKEKLRGMKKYDVDSNNVGGIFQILNMLDANRQNYDEGGSIDDQMKMALEQPMVSDDEMEDGYLDFVINEALSESEEKTLMSKLEQDEELSILFDKVIDVAQEFAGSGPVEGPGSGVSDSIPARLSDGEFVFTAKAVEEIGADKLMAMMKDAEAEADKRQQLAVGGMIDSGEEEVDANIKRQTVILDKGFVPEEDNMVDDEIKKRMMDPSTQARYVRS